MLRKIVLSLILILSPVLILAQPTSTFIMAVSDDTSTVYTTHIGFNGATVSQSGYKGIITIPVATSTTGWTDSGTSVYLTTSTDNVGIGNTNPTEKLVVTGNIDATTGTLDTLLLADTNVQTALETNDTHRADSSDPHGATLTQTNIIGTNLTGTAMTLTTLSTKDTVPLMRLSIYNPATDMDNVGTQISTQKNYIISTAYAQCIGTGATNVIFGLYESDTAPSPTRLTIVSGQTATTTMLKITSFSGGGSIPAGRLLVLDIESVSGTVPVYRLFVEGYEY